jgi:hypothetical protein
MLLGSQPDPPAPTPSAPAVAGRPRPSPSRFSALGLDARANRLLVDDLGGVGANNLGGLPAGERTLARIPFTIGRGMIHLAGDGAPGNQGDRGPILPRRVEGIAVNARVRRLHLLQAVHFDGKKDGVVDGTEVAALLVEYADGSHEWQSLVYGVDVRDWWYDPDRPDRTRAEVAWTGTNPPSRQMHQAIRLFATTWTNPHPGRRVTSIAFESAGTRAELIVLAATVEAP